MTEDTGWALREPLPAPEPPAEPPAPENTPAPSVPVLVHPAPSVPGTQPQWFTDLVAGFHGRLAAIEKALADAGIALVESEL